MMMMMLVHTTHHAHTPLRNRPTQLVLAQSLNLGFISVIPSTIMPALNKADWIKKLQDAGVQPPASWTITQLKAHWEEIQEQTTTPSQMTLQEHLQNLKRASRKKGDLTEFLEKEGMTINGNQTISTMFRAGEQLITEKYEPQSTELVGFGKHANMTFLEVKVQCPDYVQWVMDTDSESKEAEGAWPNG